MYYIACVEISCMQDDNKLRLQDHFEGTFSAEIEVLYRAVKKMGRADEGLDALTTIMAVIDGAKDAAEASGLDKILIDQFVVQYQKSRDMCLRLERYLKDLSNEDTSDQNKEMASQQVANLHLLVNSMHDISRELDRHYTRKPHLMFGPESCGCKSCSMKQKKEEEK